MVDATDLVRAYLLVTAVEANIEDREESLADALRALHAEHADAIGDLLPALPDAALVWRELCFVRRLLNALASGRPVARVALERPQRLCVTPGCGNDAVVRYCLGCEARRASTGSAWPADQDQ
jgi:hypothetical protein